jgi:uncharacterized protein
MHISKYCIQLEHPGSPDQAVLFSTRTAATVSLRREALDDLERNNLSPDEQELLFELGFLVSSPEDERDELLAYVDRMNDASKTLNATVVMNLDCNLACAYCFEGTRKGRHFLSRETADDLVRFIDDRLDKTDEIRTTFYGGEPLLSADMIAHISRRLRGLADARGIAYSFGVITNGTLLTRRIVEQLKPLGLSSASVTLDGPRKIHDRSRPFRNGGGSYDAIIRNLQDVRDLTELRIGGNYTQENYREFPGLLDALIESGLGPDHVVSAVFSPVFNEEKRFSPDFHGGCTNMNEPWIAEAGLFLRREILLRGFRTDDVLPAVCIIERPDHLVVDWDGGLYKCTGLIGRNEYCVGTLNSPIRDYRVTHDLGHWKNDRCLSCPYLPLCFGGCRYLKLIREGTMQGVACKKEYLDRALGKLVLQDMHYNKAT